MQQYEEEWKNDGKCNGRKRERDIFDGCAISAQWIVRRM